MPGREDWRLRPATAADVDGLHALAARPAVNRYLFDGVAPGRQAVADLLARCRRVAAETGLGCWILAHPAAPHAGAVWLRADLAARSAEISYLLAPDHWGRGLATRMAWTVITHAFRTPHIDRVIAGADMPNTTSLAVMARLGMRFDRNVRYPLGPGVEYVLHRDDPGPDPRPVPLPFA